MNKSNIDENFRNSKYTQPMNELTCLNISIKQSK